jgi:hypothetical protein
VNRIAIFFGILLAAMAASAEVAPGADEGASAEVALTRTVTRLDAGLFDAFNHCDAPGELQKHAGYLAEGLEFYHDKGGVTWTRAAYLANTEKNVCGHFRRELVPGSLEIFPIKDFGAIEQGWHKFCDLRTGQCFGEAQFLIVWRHLAGQWEATRIFSYGHRPIVSGEGAGGDSHRQ